MGQKEIMLEIIEERIRQEKLREEGKFLFTCASPHMPESEKLAVLAEEFGEVAKETTDVIIALAKLKATGDTTFNQRIRARKQATRKELIQVAAVAMAWIEALDGDEFELTMAGA